MLQAMHRFEVRVSRAAEGKSTKAFVGEMTDEKAMQLASKVASEGFVYLVRNLAASKRMSLHSGRVDGTG